ncbi:activator-dependent family glycosyltransferase [Streptomyces sp. NPDC020965]|uniref:activator-dependent family glycosyltransferase n=1 Tax=Streptomyces sp. NPDC020965 TaxID=3365105 RepID=UPI0037AA25E7
MRVLFATIPEKSHLYCMTPIAWAMRAAGHEVRVASTVQFVDSIAQTGMPAVAVGSNDAISAGMSANRDSQEWESLNWNELDPAKLTYEAEVERAQLFAFGCAMYNEPMMNDLVEFARSWKPDLVVWDPLTYSGPIAAGVVGAAHVRSLCFSDVWVLKRQYFRKLYDEAPADVRRDPLGDYLTGRTADHGGTFTDESVTGQLTLDPLPTSLGVPTNAPRTPIRFVPHNGPGALPDWLNTPPERPRVCMSLGASNFERYGGDYVSKTDLLEALAELDVEVVAALLPAQVAELGTVPSNVRVAQSVPLNAILPTCSALVHHGGFGSSATAMVHGVPQLVVSTLVADQFSRAQRVESQGAGIALESSKATADQVRDGVARMLGEGSFQKNADRLRDEAVAHPSPAEMVPTLERLAVERRTTPWKV